jgi:Xaa-Pro aminopeptidase
MLHQDFKNRRQRFLRAIGKGSIAILSANPEYMLNGDTSAPYRQNSDFYYLTGFTEAEALAVFIPGRKEGEFILFNLDFDPAQETWTGKRAGQTGARKTFGADQAFPITQADAIIPNLLLEKKHLYFDYINNPEFTTRINEWLRIARSKVRTGLNAPDDTSHIGKIIHEMRRTATAYEITTMKKSVEIAAQAHLRAMRFCRPGMFEYELEAELMHEYIRRGGRALAFEPIVAGGANACTLHYVRNDAKLKDGELVLIDSGVSYQYYNSDITRTFPVGKNFTTEQRAIYQAVLDAQLAVIAKIRPGVAWHVLQETARRVITEKLVELKILRGKVEDLYKKKAYHRFYMHNIGHWLGIDTHDVGKYAWRNEEWRKLEPNMIFTVEPGIYIPAHSEGVDKKWWNIGVRIEDNVLVTKKGCEVLSSDVPKTIKEIEELRNYK